MESTELVIEGERQRAPVTLRVADAGLNVEATEGPAWSAAWGDLEGLSLKIELLRVTLTVQARGETQTLSFPAYEAANLLRTARHPESRVQADVNYSTASYLAQELSVALSEERARRYLGPSVQALPPAQQRQALGISRGTAAWACLWGIAVPLAASVGLVGVFHKDDPITWGIAVAMGAVAFIVASTIGLWVAALLRPALLRAMGVTTVSK
ncbi:MAG: hypothetical protein H6739_25705 [Alphaproteobacteria bacterium]|nr:hypothetical protein [Alphaproteobacteria bacterium]